MNNNQKAAETPAILDCGHPPRVTPGTLYTNGIATNVASGKTMCYPCADRSELAAMADMSTDRFTAYVAHNNITTWSGGVLARVVRHTRSRNGFHGSEIHYYRVRDASGNYWYGRNGGDGMAITLRRAK